MMMARQTTQGALWGVAACYLLLIQIIGSSLIGQVSGSCRLLSLGAATNRKSAFTFPRSALRRQVELWPKDVADLPLKDAEQINFTSYLGSIKKIGQALVALLPAAEISPQTVLYPSFGTDAIFPVQLFPHARQIIAVDNHPFLPYSYVDGKTRYVEPVTGYGNRWSQHDFRYSGEVDTEAYLAPRILGNLTQAQPAVRIRSIEVIGTGAIESRAQSGSATGREIALPPSVDNPVHGIIAYDRGVNTPLQFFIHIQGSFPINRDPIQPLIQSWWYQEINRLAPQAIIIKAAAMTFDPQYGNLDLKQQMLEWLVQNQGVLLEGASQFHSNYEFSSYRGQFQDTTQKVVEGVAYGYKRTVLITKFK